MKPNCSDQTQPLTVILTVTQLDSNQRYVHAVMDSPKTNHCPQCQSRGGCQSLSIYQLLFAKRPLKINNKNYHIGQKLQASFPNDLLQKTLYRLLGFPLLSFIIGVIVGSFQHELLGFCLGVAGAIIAYFFARKQTQSLFNRHFKLTTPPSIAIHS